MGDVGAFGLDGFNGPTSLRVLEMPERWIWTAAPERDKFLHPCAAFTIGSHKVRMMSGPKTISQAQVRQRKISNGRDSWAWLWETLRHQAGRCRDILQPWG